MELTYCQHIARTVQRVRLIYERIMNRTGIVDNIMTSQSAKEALTYIKRDVREEIDVILLDVNMPCMSGFEFLEQEIRDLGPGFSKLVVIMLTTSLYPADKVRAEHFDMVKAYLDKPLSVNDLISTADLLKNQNQ
ncbi:MAG: response regulator [Granulosicoccus sp.]